MPKLINSVARLLMRCYPFPRGQGRLIDRTSLRRLRFDEDVLRVSCRGGFSMDVMPNDHIGRHLFLTGQFDRTIVEVLLHFARGDDRILDIGGNVGYVSCALLHMLPRCRVAAAEPLPACYELLARNLATVGGERAKAIHAAVSDLTGEGTMRMAAGNTGGSCLCFEQGPGQSDAAVVKVCVISGEELLRQSGLDRVDLIKIDVEGHELQVLRALEPMIHAQRPRAIVFEHNGDLGIADSPIRRLLDGCEYRILGIRKSLLSWSLASLDESAPRGLNAHDYVAVPEPRRDGKSAAPGVLSPPALSIPD